MGSYHPTENPCIMRREQLKTKSSEYIFIFQDDLYIASTTPQAIFHILEDKYKTNIYLDGKYLHDPSGTVIYQLRKYLEKS